MDLEGYSAPCIHHLIEAKVLIWKPFSPSSFPSWGFQQPQPLLETRQRAGRLGGNIPEGQNAIGTLLRLGKHSLKIAATEQLLLPKAKWASRPPRGFPIARYRRTTASRCYLWLWECSVTYRICILCFFPSSFFHACRTQFPQLEMDESGLPCREGGQPVWQPVLSDQTCSLLTEQRSREAGIESRAVSVLVYAPKHCIRWRSESETKGFLKELWVLTTLE